jgi:hypothetical protein
MHVSNHGCPVQLRSQSCPVRLINVARRSGPISRPGLLLTQVLLRGGNRSVPAKLSEHS